MKEIHIGVTGTRSNITDYQDASVRAFLSACNETAGSGGTKLVLHHGDCIGADVHIARIARDIGYKIVCHPPIKDGLRGWFESDVTLDPKNYLARNRDIVDQTQMLLVVPYQMEHQNRGGTWYTHDYAKQREVFLRIFWPQRKT